jgi:hypothetical protein
MCGNAIIQDVNLILIVLAVKVENAKNKLDRDLDNLFPLFLGVGLRADSGS